MKRMLSATLISLAFLLSLSGCIVIPIYKNFDLDPETVSSVQIYDLRFGDSYYDDFLEQEFLLVHTLEASQTSDFLSDLAEIRFSDHLIISIAAMDPSFHYGDWVVRVNYTSGAYSLISCDGYGTEYDANGELIKTHHFGCDNEEWKDLIMRYLPIAES